MDPHFSSDIDTLFGLFSIIGSLDAACFTLLRTLPAWPMSEALIESRQFIGWWRDAVFDAITSSAYTGEHAIYSSDFSAFTKRSHCPLLLQFSGPTYILRSSICTLATASVELCSPRGEVPWSIAAVNRHAHDSSLAKTHTVSALSAWVFRMHVTRFTGSRNANFARISVS